MSRITRLNPPQLTDFSQQGFSQISVMEPGRVAYVSGQVAWSAEGGPVPTDVVEQMRLVGINVHHALRALGATTADVVMARVYVTDLTEERLGRLMQPLRDIFGDAQPSLTGVGVDALAGEGLQVELELTVRLPD
jgi:enamine deaminase RidA (YjgF/YER057c/UK114 family)